MNRWKLSARAAALVVIATAAAASGAAQKAAKHKEAAPDAQQQQEQQATPSPGNSMGYGVKLGGFFTDQHKQVAKRPFAQYYAKNKNCPKDMERQGKTCRAVVQGHYWAVGQTLQKAVETFPVPEEVIARLPPAPKGYEYVRAGEDILLISSALHLVVDEMQDVAGA